MPLLPRKLKRSRAARDRRRGGRAAWSGRSERFVARVLLVADADERGLEQAHDGREHLLARQRRGGARSRSTAAADARQGPARRRSCGRTWSRRGPRASAGGSGTACARGRRGRWPGGGRRRRGQIQTSVQAGGMASARNHASAVGSGMRPAVGTDVAEPPAGAPAPDAGPGVAHVAQAGLLGGGLRVEGQVERLGRHASARWQAGCQQASEPPQAGHRLRRRDPAVIDRGPRLGQRHPRRLELLVSSASADASVSSVARNRCMSSVQKPGAV